VREKRKTQTKNYHWLEDKKVIFSQHITNNKPFSHHFIKYIVQSLVVVCFRNGPRRQNGVDDIGELSPHDVDI